MGNRQEVVGEAPEEVEAEVGALHRLYPAQRAQEEAGRPRGAAGWTAVAEAERCWRRPLASGMAAAAGRSARAPGAAADPLCSTGEAQEERRRGTRAAFLAAAGPGRGAGGRSGRGEVRVGPGSGPDQVPEAAAPACCGEEAGGAQLPCSPPS